jgi:hypothetical protein
MPRAALALLMLAAPPALAQNESATAQSLTLALPRAMVPGETAWIEIELGAISKGRVVTVTTADGQPLGTISPFGARPGQDAGTYPLPVPAGVVRDGRVAIRVTISDLGGGPPRAPTAQEVRGIKLGIGPAR